MRPARLLLVSAVSAALLLGLSASTAKPATSWNSDVRSFNGDGTQYTRVAPANYTDGASGMQAGPNARLISNVVFNDLGQNLFSENNLSQFVWAWGQFVDHDLDLRDETPAESVPIPFLNDPLERFSNQVGSIGFNRTPAAPGSGVRSPRQQINQLSAYLDGSMIYGSDMARDQWLRGPNGTLLLPDGYLPKVTARGDASTAPTMDLMGQLAGNPSDAIVAGDKRANENIALTALQTLFVREHNRIVAKISYLNDPELEFQIARKIVGAEIEYITYRQFLPTLKITLPAYTGYQPKVNAGIGNEFATVGFRAHSMVHGDFDVEVRAGTYSSSELAAFASQGVLVAGQADGSVDLSVPLALAFGNPDLLKALGIRNFLPSLLAHQYRNDEQIDDELRSVLFQVPGPSATPSQCGEPMANPACFSDIADLGADDVMRGRDHGMPSYNELRVAYGLAPVTSFEQITGEPAAPPADLGNPGILAFTALYNVAGQQLPAGDQENAVTGVRATTLASRLHALYGSVDKLDAFVGMVSEKHLPGLDFGPLQAAIWAQQFAATRDGDRLFYLNDPQLEQIAKTYGISYRYSLAQVIEMNTGATLRANVFRVP